MYEWIELRSFGEKWIAISRNFKTIWASGCFLNMRFPTWLFQQIFFPNIFVLPDPGEINIVEKTDARKLKKIQLLKFVFRSFNGSLNFELFSAC